MNFPQFQKFEISFYCIVKGYEPQPNKNNFQFHVVTTHLNFVKAFPSLTLTDSPPPPPFSPPKLDEFFSSYI